MLLRYISLCLVLELLARQEDIYFQVNEEITAQKSNDKYRELIPYTLTHPSMTHLTYIPWLRAVRSIDKLAYFDLHSGA